MNWLLENSINVIKSLHSRIDWQFRVSSTHRNGESNQTNNAMTNGTTTTLEWTQISEKRDPTVQYCLVVYRLE